MCERAGKRSDHTSRIAGRVDCARPDRHVPLVSGIGSTSEPGQKPPKFDTSALSAIASVSEVGSAEVYGEPNSRLILCRPRHPVGALSGNQNVVAPTKVALTMAFNTETRRAGEE